ncbi:hypothetical protein MKOR_32360 [Mycolicibacillus koreensis]|nr:hypothetical protein MKOR_32360 [Mycolicibacillus koreensis]
MAAAVVAGSIAGLVTVVVMTRGDDAGPVEEPVAQTKTVTASPPPPPEPLPAEQADEKTCAGWDDARSTVLDAASALSVIPDGMDVLSPEVQTHPDWKAGVAKASRLFEQAADTLADAKAAGTSPMLGHVTDTTVGTLRTVSVAYETFAPESGNAFDAFHESQLTMDWLCP